MIAGIPGTGIGGIFYLLLVGGMPFREGLRTLQGQTTVKRWSFIGLQLFFVVSILAAMGGGMWLLHRLLNLLPHTSDNSVLFLGNKVAIEQPGRMAFLAATAGFISLTFVFMVVCVLRICVSRPKNTTIRPLAATKPQYQPA
jgi:hypothetical protein